MHIAFTQDDVLPVVKFGRDEHSNDWKMYGSVCEGNFTRAVDSSATDSGQKGLLHEKHGNNNNQLLEECLVVSVGVVISVR